MIAIKHSTQEKFDQNHSGPFWPLVPQWAQKQSKPFFCLQTMTMTTGWYHYTLELFAVYTNKKNRQSSLRFKKLFWTFFFFNIECVVVLRFKTFGKFGYHLFSTSRNTGRNVFATKAIQKWYSCREYLNPTVSNN